MTDSGYLASDVGSAMPEAFDVIVCGAGSSGSTVAGRLAEDGSRSVLLLEAGPTDEVGSVRDPHLWPTNLGTDRTWNFTAAASAELGGRTIPYLMGRGLGGGASVNVGVWARGHRADWNSYAGTVDDPSWDYDHVLEVYRRIETYTGTADPRRGTTGPMPIEQLSAEHPFHDAVRSAAAEVGIPAMTSLNGELMERAAGTAPRDADVRDGTRQSPYSCYVRPKHQQPNLTVHTDATVAEVLFDGRRAVGVRLSDGRTFAANTQVVLSLGAINTPAVLLRSGIGDAPLLSDLGVAVRQHLPGVGRNLHDHVLVPVIWSARDKTDLPPPFLATDGIQWDLEDPDGPAVAMYVDSAVVPSETTAARHAIPDRGVTFLAGVRLRSRGRVTLPSKEDDAEPVISPGYFAHPDDMAAMTRVIRTVSRIGDSAALSSFVERRMLPPADADDAAVEQYIREAAQTFWHQCGTAAMGTDGAAVVDALLRVRGLDGLRVIDASVLPHVPVANTMAPSVVIGELGASFVLADLSTQEPSSGAGGR